MAQDKGRIRLRNAGDGQPPCRADCGRDGGSAQGAQAELLAALKLTLPERLCADREVADPSNLGLPIERTPPKM